MAEIAEGAGGGDRGSAPAHSTRWRNRILFGGGVLLAALVRWPLLSHETGDYGGFLSVWYDFIVLNGHFAALQYDFYNYNPPYLYLLAAIASAAPGLPDLLAIKAVSLAFEPLLAFLVFRCVRLRFPDSATRPGLAALAALFAPTVVLNGAFWAQCDAIHTTLLVACLYFVLKERPAAAWASFGLAFAFKGSALFFLPALLWIAALEGPTGRYPGAGLTGRAFLWAPLVYLLALLPPWLQGRPLYDLLSTYFDQAGEHRELTKLAPNLYQWVPDDWYAFWPLGVLVTVAVVAGVTLAVRRSRALPAADLLVTLSAFSLILAPYLLPKMHDRYFFAADVFTVLLAFWRPRFWYAPIAMGLTSANSYYEVAFRWDVPLVPLAWAAVVPLLLLVLLGRQLLRDLGYAPRPARFGPWLRREFARRKAAAIPAALLALTLGGMFLFAWQGGRFARPVSVDPVAAGTLARVANLSPDTFFARFSHRTLEADGAVAYHLDSRGAPGGDLALRFVTGQFPRDRTAQLFAARALMALFFFGAAVLAYLALARLFAHRLPALAAVLLVFPWFWAGSGDVVAAAGPPALFGVFLAFHGLVVFSQEGRLRPLLVACGAALLFSFTALALILPFVLAYVLFAEYARRKRRPGEAETPPPGFRPGLDRKLPVLAGFAAAFAVALWGLGALNDRALLEGEGVRDGASVAGSSLLAAADEAGSGRADGHSFPGIFRSLGSGFVPGGDRGSGAALVVGLLLTLAGAVGAARSRWRVPFLALALSGFLPAFAAGGAGPPEVERLAHLGLVLVVVSPGLSALGRLRGEWPGRAAAGLAVAFALFLGHRGADAGYDPETAAREARIRTDFEQIRRALLRREEVPTVFVPADPFRDGEFGGEFGGEFAGGRATAWYLAGVVLAGEERRAAADYLLTDEPVSRPGRLAAGTREVFLHHRAAHDGELGARIEAAGAPRLSSEFEVFLERGGRLLYVREDCAPENLEGTFVLHLLPRDEADLPPHRRRYGFENRSFRFDDRTLDTGERCVAAVRLPDYELRNLVTGRFLRDDEGRLTPVWRGEFDPSAPPGGPE